MMKTISRIFAIPANWLAAPPKPKMAATKARTANVMTSGIMGRMGSLHTDQERRYEVNIAVSVPHEWDVANPGDSGFW